MADEHQFIEDGLQRSQINEFFETELGRAGYGGMDVAKTPMGTQIVLKAEKPGMVIGKGGKNIRKVTRELEERFDMDDPQIDVQEVDEPDLNAKIVADRLANALERGWYFRKAGHTTIDRIMDAGALGAEIVLSGKVTGARSRVEKFNRGYVKHNGEPAEDVVDEGQGVAVMKLGTIGVTVKIIPPGAKLPDDFDINEDAEAPEVEQTVEEEGVEDLLADVEEGETPEVPDHDEPEIPDESPEEAIDEEIVEEVVEEAQSTDSSRETAEGAPEESNVGTASEEAVEVAEEEDLDEDVEAEAEELVAEMEAEEESETDDSAESDADEDTTDEAEDGDEAETADDDTDEGEE
ncbi:30S ribosomal protein S3 [Halorarum halophilum]|uniref:Small ribosomal subunit protein uS3 n=1 Tax=Halorarum halophilum TaxID=2743090 RepID=A0A7D5GFM7_9EURY|nr:30S ribosomal protein S3 [Halobaculum halophilum]QLG26131.1 30S ribosomal protein S3 [Halobaculum halophilum]